MLEIAVNGRFFGRRMTGVDRFAIECLRAIDESMNRSPSLKGRLAIRLLVPPKVMPSVEFRNISVHHVGHRSGQLWEQWDLPRAVKPSEVLLNLCNTAPLWRRKQIVAIHDAATVSVPEAFSRSFRLWYRIMSPILGWSARKIMTVSEFSKAELARCFAIPEHKITVMCEGSEHVHRQSGSASDLAAMGLGNRPFVLAVSSVAPHKNFSRLLQAYASIESPGFDIAIAGGRNERVFGSALGAQVPGVHWLGYVTDAQLHALYNHALCFAFPSIYEGFGIPPLEAMQCGCPVIAARAAAIPEICGDAALYFDPYSVEELARAMSQVAASETLRETLRQAGARRVKAFTWDQAAGQLLSACTEVEQAA